MFLLAVCCSHAVLDWSTSFYLHQTNCVRWEFSVRIADRSPIPPPSKGSIRLAVASRSPVDEGGAARGILGALRLLDLFCCLEIHTGSKAKHFQNIHAATGVEYRDMLFFDDEKHNIKTVRRLGVTCVKVSKESGLTFADVNAGLKEYREACLSRSSLRGWFTPAAPKEDSEHAGQAKGDSADGACKDEPR
ncbi:unnamed protein product [Ectocarpus sp. 8 AP-2014]